MLEDKKKDKDRTSREDRKIEVDLVYAITLTQPHLRRRSQHRSQAVRLLPRAGESQSHHLPHRQATRDQAHGQRQGRRSVRDAVHKVTGRRDEGARVCDLAGPDEDGGERETVVAEGTGDHDLQPHECRCLDGISINADISIRRS